MTLRLLTRPVRAAFIVALAYFGLIGAIWIYGLNYSPGKAGYPASPVLNWIFSKALEKSYRPAGPVVIVYGPEGGANGTGFLVTKQPCYLTAGHVVSQWLSTDGSAPAEFGVLDDRQIWNPGFYVKKISVEQDIALLCSDQIHEYDQGPVTVFRDSHPPLGTAVEVIGYDHLLEEINYLPGVLIGVRSETVKNLRWDHVLLFEGDVIPGYSGSPLFADGEVIGMVVGVYQPPDGKPIMRKTCMAVSAKVLMEFLATT